LALPTFAGTPMPIQSYRDLIVWQRAMDLLTECYRIARILPPTESYALGTHLERAAVAVAANIAGGHARERADFLAQLTIATAALREVETLLLAATRVCLLSADQIQGAMRLGDEVGRMLTALRRSLGAPHLQPPGAGGPHAGPSPAPTVG
jgi:four helix bundle protein